MNKDQKARQRAEVIFRKLNGQITGQQAARELGISRKTYYQWEKRALMGMVNELRDEEPGRPETVVDPEKEALRQRVAELEAREQTWRKSELFRHILKEMERQPTLSKKNH